MQDCLHFVLGHEFCKRGGGSVRCQADPGESFAADAANHLGQLVNFLAGQRRNSVFGSDAAHTAAAGNRARENGETAILHQIAQVKQLHAVAGIGLVGAKTLHRFAIGQPGQRESDIHAERFLEHTLHKALADLQNILHRDEGHLQVDLGEFRLAVSAQILVAEAAGNLHITVKARHHGKLLVKLRRLRQGVKAALVDAARHQKIASALRSRADQHRGLDFDEAVFVKIVAGDLGYLVAE